ncbi:right-handed parallel beta-helix repeat-containing protein [Chitinophaga sp. Hz27]|uniref:right-handed parallel beta-helix repeat-containing protein n=1 Tax=Chitinophaga sp. Hz27 TaxID=3347169 RepID=UPI0035DB8375
MSVYWSFACVIMAIMSCSGSSADRSGVTVKPASHAIYVAATGVDGAAGDIHHPLKTINVALGKARPGDSVILRGGTYNQLVVANVNGTITAPVTLSAMPGERVLIDGTGILTSAAVSLLTISNAHFLTVNGLEFCNLRTATQGTEVNGITVNNGATAITLRNNRVYNIASELSPEQGRSGHGILLIGNTSEPLQQIIVENNEIHDTQTGYSENLTINGYVDGFIIRGNKIYNTENIGIDAAGGYAANPNPVLNYARNGLISDNELYNIDMTRGPIGSIHGHGAIAIYVDGARNIIVERNKIHDADRGIGIVSENDAFPTSNCIVRNNFVYNCWRTGIYLGGYLGYTSGGTRDCYVVNNTLFMNNKVPGAFGEIEGELRLTEQCFNNIVRNNLVYARPVDVFLHKYTNTGRGNMVDNNWYYTTGTPQWIWNSTNGNPYTDLISWQRASGMDAVSVYGQDPQLRNVDLPDIHLKASSGAKSSGMLLPDSIVGALDIDGKPRISDSHLSIGAHQL